MTTVTKNPLFVHNRECVISRDRTMATPSFGAEYVLMGRDPVTHYSFLARLNPFDPSAKADSISRIFEELRKLNVDLTKMTFQLKGGWRNVEPSNELGKNIRLQLTRDLGKRIQVGVDHYLNYRGLDFDSVNAFAGGILDPNKDVYFSFFKNRWDKIEKAELARSLNPNRSIEPSEYLKITVLAGSSSQEIQEEEKSMDAAANTPISVHNGECVISRDRRLATPAFGGEYVLMGRDPVTHYSFLARLSPFSRTSDVDMAISEIFGKLQDLGVEPDQMKFRLKGGWKNHGDSHELGETIHLQLQFALRLPLHKRLEERVRCKHYYKYQSAGVGVTTAFTGGVLDPSQKNYFSFFETRWSKIENEARARFPYITEGFGKPFSIEVID